MHNIRVMAVVVALIFPVMCPAQQQTSPRKVAPKPKALAISPYFAQRAFSFKQALDRMTGESVEPLVEGDWESSPFEIRNKALTEAMDSTKLFGLRTAGDRSLFRMLEVASLFANHESLLRSIRSGIVQSARDSGAPLPAYHMPLRTGQCLVEIQLAIEERLYRGDGNCAYNEAVRNLMEEERGAAERAAEREHLKVIDEYKRKDAEECARMKSWGWDKKQSSTYDSYCRPQKIEPLKTPCDVTGPCARD